MADMECRRDLWNPNLKHELRFVASMSVCPSDIRKIRQHVEIAQASIDPLRSILVTPLFIGNESLKLVRQMAEEGRFVIFDSGGYYVQLGRLRYEELYMPLLNAYRANRWASVYTLPDHVPTSQDTPDAVDRKVRDTIRFSTLFFEEMPDELKPRAMPVVQGHTYKQVDECLRAYIRLGVKRIGFGSFGTQGQNSEVNIATRSAVEIARYVINVAHDNGMQVHLFGLGTPSLVAMIKGIKADSFDSATWLKSAGFGQVFLPFMRAYNISYEISVSELQKGITFEQFNQWKRLTGHRCQLCENPVNLNAYKMHRAVHNLIVMAETVARVNSGNRAHIQAIYKAGSPKYRREFERWLE